MGFVLLETQIGGKLFWLDVVGAEKTLRDTQATSNCHSSLLCDSVVPVVKVLLIAGYRH
jgi:hypothetical protein